MLKSVSKLSSETMGQWLQLGQNKPAQMDATKTYSNSRASILLRLQLTSPRVKQKKEFVFNFMYVAKEQIRMFMKKATRICSVIFWAWEVMKRTTPGDWRFDNLSGNYLQGHATSVCQSYCYNSRPLKLIGLFSLDGTGWRTLNVGQQSLSFFYYYASFDLPIFSSNWDPSVK